MKTTTNKGWLKRHKWLLLRRISQLSILSLFLLGPWFGIWIVKGNLASNLTLETLPLTDPYILLQSIFAGQAIATTALIGAAIVLSFYFIVSGRVYCSWVCPINMITDMAANLRDRFNIKSGTTYSRTTRYWILGMTFVVASLTGTIAWEFFNPVSMIYRGLIFGMGLAWGIVVAIFCFDLLISKRAWCSHLCPVGAFYSLLGNYSVLRVRASKRHQCDDCMDCFRICPEPQVIQPALKGEKDHQSPVILSPNCTNCGRCIDICDRDVFNFSTRFNNKWVNK